MSGKSTQPTLPHRPAETPPALEDTPDASDTALFKKMLGTLDVRFSDDYPEEPPRPLQASARRMRQLERGQLHIGAQLDLHGCDRMQALEKVGHFLRNSALQELQAVLVITGQGLHSSEEPVLRSAVEAYLRGEGRRFSVEWSRAPRRLGGEGALVVFLRKGQASS